MAKLLTWKLAEHIGQIESSACGYAQAEGGLVASVAVLAHELEGINFEGWEAMRKAWLSAYDSETGAVSESAICDSNVTNSSDRARKAWSRVSQCLDTDHGITKPPAPNAERNEKAAEKAAERLAAARAAVAEFRAPAAARTHAAELVASCDEAEIRAGELLLSQVRAVEAAEISAVKKALAAQSGQQKGAEKALREEIVTAIKGCHDLLKLTACRDAVNTALRAAVHAPPKTPPKARAKK